jgi:hypothetical protein
MRGREGLYLKTFEVIRARQKVKTKAIHAVHQHDP